MNPDPRIAEEKAVLALQCGLACRKPPPSVLGGSIQTTREWVKARRSAMSVLRDQRHSRNDLHYALALMQSFVGTGKPE